MSAVEIMPSITSVPRQEWVRLTHGQDIDRGYDYLRFREHLDPGDSLVIAAKKDDTISAAAHGATTAASTGFFSHPWKMLASDALLRADDHWPLNGLRSDRDRILDGLLRGSADPDRPLWSTLEEEVGDLYVIRGYDDSDLQTDAAVAGEDRQEALAFLLKAAQSYIASSSSVAGIALPFVNPNNADLRGVLEGLGFHGGVTTGVSTIPIGDAASYQDYLDSLRSRLRMRHRKEWKDLEKAGFSIDDLDLSDRMDEIIHLELQTTEKNGGTPNPPALQG